MVLVPPVYQIFFYTMRPIEASNLLLLIKVKTKTQSEASFCHDGPEVTKAARETQHRPIFFIYLYIYLHVLHGLTSVLPFYHLGTL